MVDVYGHVARKVKDMALFWHAPASVRTVDFVDDVVASVNLTGLTTQVVKCEEIFALPGEPSLSGVLVDKVDVVIFWDLASVIEKRRAAEWFKIFRPFCMDRTSEGHKLLLISSLPKGEFPDVPGSTILADYPDYFYVELEESEHGNSMRWCPSMPGLAAQFDVNRATRERESESALSKTALAKLRRSTAVECVSDALLESDPGAITWLMSNIEVLKDESLKRLAIDSTSLEELPVRIQASLYSSGIVSQDPQTEGRFFVGGNLSEGVIKEAVLDANSRTIKTPEKWADVAKRSIEIERLVRRILFEEVQALGGWEQHSTVKAIWKKAERGYRASDSRQRLFDPLEWLELSDEIDFASELSNQGRRVGGYSKSDWLTLKERILPIRNRVMHARLPEENDLNVCSTELRRLRSAWEKAKNERRKIAQQSDPARSGVLVVGDGTDIEADLTSAIRGQADLSPEHSPQSHVEE